MSRKVFVQKSRGSKIVRARIQGWPPRPCQDLVVEFFKRVKKPLQIALTARTFRDQGRIGGVIARDFLNAASDRDNLRQSANSEIRDRRLSKLCDVTRPASPRLSQTITAQPQHRLLQRGSGAGKDKIAVDQFLFRVRGCITRRHSKRMIRDAHLLAGGAEFRQSRGFCKRDRSLGTTIERAAAAAECAPCRRRCRASPLVPAQCLRVERAGRGTPHQPQHRPRSGENERALPATIQTRGKRRWRGHAENGSAPPRTGCSGAHG